MGRTRPCSQSWAGRRIGEITPEVSALTGLAAGTPVIAGGNDQPCAGLGMGMTAPGKIMLSTGTAWVLMSVVEAPSLEAAPPWVNVYFHAVPNRWLGGQLVGGFGATVDWWLRQMWPEAAGGEWRSGTTGADTAGTLYARLDEAVRNNPPGSRNLLFLSLSGPSQIANASPGGGFIGMELAHTRADMCRAVLEGCAYEVRWALDELRSVHTGVGASMPAVEELWLAGGASTSPVWPQILADICGLPIVIAGYASWAALGTAALAGWGIGAYVTLEGAIKCLQPTVSRIDPNPGLADLYAERLDVYKQVARAVDVARRG